MKKIFVLALLAVFCMSLAACAPGTNVDLNDKTNREITFTTPGPNPEVGTPAENGNVAGLGTGIFHGLIALITLITSVAVLTLGCDQLNKPIGHPSGSSTEPNRRAGRLAGAASSRHSPERALLSAALMS